MDFPSIEWAIAWAASASADPACLEAGAGFGGAVAAVIRSDERWQGGPLYLRLEGAEGTWTRAQIGAEEDLIRETLFTLSAEYSVWKRVFRQELDPIRGLIQGQVRVHGQLSSVLRWTKAFRLMVALASDIQTTFADEVDT